MEAHPAQACIEQPGPRDDSEGPSEPERGKLAHMVQVRSGVDVLSRVGVVADPPYHFGLLGDVRRELGPVDDCVGLDDEEGGDRCSDGCNQSSKGGGNTAAEVRILFVCAAEGGDDV